MVISLSGSETAGLLTALGFVNACQIICSEVVVWLLWPWILLSGSTFAYYLIGSRDCFLSPAWESDCLPGALRMKACSLCSELPAQELAAGWKHGPQQAAQLSWTLFGGCQRTDRKLSSRESASRCHHAVSG